MIHLKDDDPMPMGKHKGAAMVNVPAADLIYYYETYPDLHSQVKRQNKFNSR